MKKLLAKAYVEKVNGKMLAVATDETVDRHGESLPIDAWDLKNFKKNPVLQFAHDYYSPPVGKAKNIKRDGDRLLFEPEFHEITQSAREIKKMYEEGYMNSFSVGFIYHKKGEGEKAKITLELLEISAVPIPANPAATVLEKAVKEEKENEEAKEKIKTWLKKDTEEAPEDEEPEVDNEVDCSTDNEDEDEVEEPEVQVKEGKVLSKATRSKIETAVEALNALLEADKKEEPEKGLEAGEDLEVCEEYELGEELEVKAESTTKKSNNTKGRRPELKTLLETVSSQLGYTNRKLKKL